MESGECEGQNGHAGKERKKTRIFLHSFYKSATLAKIFW